MTHPTDDSLKPCPFCGGAASLHPRTCDKNTPYNPADRAFPIARCGQCGAEAVGKDWGRPETAAEKWNARALLAEQARTEPTKLESNIHESSETYLHADVEAACWGEYTVEASRDNKGADWYIVVTAPNGMRDYDGYWRNSAHKTVDDVINEAICGACLTAVPQPQPLKAEQAKDAGEDAKFMDAFKSGQAIRVDWPMEPSTPEEALELLDMMDVEYAKTMGKSAPDAEMGNSMRRVRHMACDLWAWQKETMRESFNEAIRAARAAERKA